MPELGGMMAAVARSFERESSERFIPESGLR
jgi:hypothetical protein